MQQTFAKAKISKMTIWVHKFDMIECFVYKFELFKFSNT